MHHGYDQNYSFDERESPDLEHIRNGIKVLENNRIEILPDVKVDLGGIGKGWAIDSIKRILVHHGYAYFLINGGGDIYVTSDKGAPISFFLENPFDSTEEIGVIELKDAAFACSSPTKRIWQTKQGNVHHHLVDARRGRSVTDTSAVFTYGKNALSVDTASTCIFISPKEDAFELATALDVEFLTVFPDSTIQMSAGFPGKLNS